MSQSVENLKVFNGALNYPDYENAVSAPKIMEFDNIIASNHTENRNSNAPLFDGHHISAAIDNLSSIHDNLQHVTTWKSNGRNAASSRPSYQFSSSTPKIVNVTSLDDSALANTSNCDDTFDISSRKCNLRSAIEYCKVLSSVSCIIHLPLYSHITQRYGAIDLSSTSGAYCDIVIEGGNSMISASSSQNDRFIIVTGSRTIQFYNLEFQNFGKNSLLGGVMYFSAVLFASVKNVTFERNAA